MTPCFGSRILATLSHSLEGRNPRTYFHERSTMPHTLPFTPTHTHTQTHLLRGPGGHRHTQRQLGLQLQPRSPVTVRALAPLLSLPRSRFVHPWPTPTTPHMLPGEHAATFPISALPYCTPVAPTLPHTGTAPATHLLWVEQRHAACHRGPEAHRLLRSQAHRQLQQGRAGGGQALGGQPPGLAGQSLRTPCRRTDAMGRWLSAQVADPTAPLAMVFISFLHPAQSLP